MTKSMNQNPLSGHGQSGLPRARWIPLALMLTFGVLWMGGVPSPLIHMDQVEAQSAPKWKEQAAGIIPTEFGELLSVNGTSGNYSLVFRDSDKKLRIVDLRGGKVPNRTLVIQRK